MQRHRVLVKGEELGFQSQCPLFFLLRVHVAAFGVPFALSKIVTWSLTEGIIP